MINGDPTLNSQETNTEIHTEWQHSVSANCLPIGTRIAEFEVTGVIGEGGFGNVYLAFDHSLQRTVAIKEYMPISLASRGVDHAVLVQTKRYRATFETGMNSFINEARLLAQFDHSGLIKVYRFWEQNNTAYMAMRYYEGHTLKKIIRHYPKLLTEAWLKSILKQILEALEILYAIQILHRDISPENIMIQSNGDAVLLDFGAARQIITDMTQDLTVILKPGYAPIEQYAQDGNMHQGAWTDIYALSAVIYSAITKSPPPTSVTRLFKDPISLLQHSVREGFSKEFLTAIDRGMAVKPEDRPQSIAEFKQLLGIDSIDKLEPILIPNKTVKDNLSARPNNSNTRSHHRRSKKNIRSSSPKNVSFEKIKRRPILAIANKGSWALVIAGVTLAAVTSVYQHVPQNLDAVASVTQSSDYTVARFTTDQTMRSTAQTELNTILALYTKGDYHGAIMEFNAVETKLKPYKEIELTAIKITAFSYCLMNQITLCQRQFENAIKLEPSFDLAQVEKGYPLWNTIFDRAKKRNQLIHKY